MEQTPTPNGQEQAPATVVQPATPTPLEAVERSKLPKTHVTRLADVNYKTLLAAMQSGRWPPQRRPRLAIVRVLLAHGGLTQAEAVALGVPAPTPAPEAA